MLQRCVSVIVVFAVAINIGISVQASTDRPLGIVTQATAANLRTTPASSGTTVYDGDVLSTAPGGQLYLRSGSATIYLGARSTVTMHRVVLDSTSDRTQATLTSGTGILSATQSSALEINADRASIRPARDQATVGQVTIVSPKELNIFARRGALEFSYNGDTGVIEEGKAYHVFLDPPDDLDSDPPHANSKGQPIPRHKRRHKAFLFVLIPGAAYGMSVIVHHFVESPDRP